VTKQGILSSPLFWAGSLAIALAPVLAGGCSSSPPSATECTSGEAVPCTCANGRSGTSACGSSVCSCDEGEDAGSGADADAGTTPIDTPGDATHLDEKPAPTTVYGACALQGSFGWPCSATTSGPDPTDCTDPNFPDCFVGGQGSWCTASCATFGVCPPGDQDGGDAGCTPSACNARGYCK
jgi:hypothetical protein